jgi:hypothetical protein
VSDTEDFLGSVMPRVLEADTAIHNGDAGPRSAIWSPNDPVTLFGAVLTGTGWGEIRQVFETLASRFSNGSYDYEVIAAGASGDLGYVVGIEHSSASVGGAAPEAYDCEPRRSFAGRTVNGESCIGTLIRCRISDAARRQLARINEG